MSFYIQMLMSALVIGTFYGVVGLGITFVLRVTRVLNLSHSAVAMLAGMTYASGIAAGYSILPVVIAVLTLGAALGWAQGVFLRPWLGSHNEVLTVFLTLAIGLLLEGLGLIVFSKDPLGAPAVLNIPNLHVAGAVMTGAQLVLVGLTVFATGVFAVWYYASYTGKLYRAMVDDEYGALVLGVSVMRLRSVAFGIGGLIAAVAGIGITPIMSMSYTTAGIMLVNGVTASILGGVSNPFGALAGGLLVGLIQTLVAGTISSVLMLPASMALLLIVLIVRPDGLMPTRRRERVI